MLLNIEQDELLDLLMNRVKFWTRRDGEVDDIAERLYEQMYDRFIECFGFDDAPFGKYGINEIVDNDIINNCDIVYKDDDRYEAIKKHYDENGLSDVSCEKDCDGYSYIEAYDEETGAFLMRY